MEKGECVPSHYYVGEFAPEVTPAIDAAITEGKSVYWHLTTSGVVYVASGFRGTVKIGNFTGHASIMWTPCVGIPRYILDSKTGEVISKVVTNKVIAQQRYAQTLRLARKLQRNKPK